MSKRAWAIITLIIAALMGLAAVTREEPEPKRFCVPLYDQTGLECVKCE